MWIEQRATLIGPDHTRITSFCKAKFPVAAEGDFTCVTA
jgi:hypothetical protein